MMWETVQFVAVRILFVVVTLFLAGCASPAPKQETNHPGEPTPQYVPIAERMPHRDFLVLWVVGDLEQKPAFQGPGYGSACGRPAGPIMTLDIQNSSVVLARGNETPRHDFSDATWLVVLDDVQFTHDGSSCDLPFMWGVETSTFRRNWGDVSISAQQNETTMTIGDRTLAAGDSIEMFAVRIDERGNRFEGNVEFRLFRWNTSDVVEELGFDTSAAGPKGFWSRGRD